MNETPRPRLSARNLAGQRGEQAVFDCISLAIGPGDLIVLRGANGAGKTTLLRILSGLASPSAGSLERDEQSTVFLGHADGVKGALTARENIEFWSKIYTTTALTADAAVSALRVSPYLQQRASTLSAGQRRRLALCRAAISARPIWILDEPTAGMDADSVAAVIRLINDHCREGGSALIATHEPLELDDTTTITLVSPEAH